MADLVAGELAFLHEEIEIMRGGPGQSEGWVYTQKRDMKRIYANESTRWLRYSPPSRG